MALTLELETLFLETLNTSQIYQITNKVRFVKGLANSILTYVPKMIHICPNRQLDDEGHAILFVGGTQKVTKGAMALARGKKIGTL